MKVKRRAFRSQKGLYITSLQSIIVFTDKQEGFTGRYGRKRSQVRHGGCGELRLFAALFLSGIIGVRARWSEQRASFYRQRCLTADCAVFSSSSSTLLCQRLRRKFSLLFGLKSWDHYN